MRRDILPYNQKLVPIAKLLRKNMTYAEVMLWNELKTNQLLLYDFDRKRPIGNYIVDFYCKDLKLAIEVLEENNNDNILIRKEKVNYEDLESIGVQFLFFRAIDILSNRIAVLEKIENWIINFEKENGASEFVIRKRNILKNLPTPTPPKRG